MGLLDRLFGERRTQVISADDRLSALLGKLEISPDTAGEIPAVSACTDFISSCIAGLTVRLYREKPGENTTEEIRNDNRLRLLNDETGDLLDPYQMKQAVITDFFLYGSGFIYPEMNGNEVLSLRYIRHGSISAYMGSDPVYKYGEYVLSNGMRLRDDEVIRLLRDTKDGMTGESVILQHQQLLTAAYREIVYEKLLVSSGGNKKGFLTSENKLDKDKLAELRQAWNDMYANSGNTMMVLNKGLQFHESSNTSVEMQLNQNQAKNNELICQLFGLSPEAVCGKASDEVIVSAIKGAVIPVVTAFEAALNRGLLLPSERDDMYFAFDTSELLKGDILKRYQAYKTGLESNVLQIDEVRYKEDLPPLGINFIKLGLQDVLYDPKTKTIYTPNMNQSMTMSENKVNFGNDEVDNAGQDGIMEERFRKDQDRDEHGRFAFEGSSGSPDSGNLTEREETSLNAYISSESYIINEKLRSGQKLTNEERQMLEDLDSALEKMPKFEGTVYRSLSSDMMSDPEEFWNLHQPGSIVRYKAYTSSSLEVYDESMDVQCEIVSRTGRNISAYNENEKEVLFPRDSYFRVRKVSGKTIYMEEI